jgi:hypothetical protein
MCDGPPFMKRKMTRLAFARKWGGLLARGDAASLAARWVALACCWNMAFRASEPNPHAELRRKFRREKRGDEAGSFMGCFGGRFYSTKRKLLDASTA